MEAGYGEKGALGGLRAARLGDGSAGSAARGGDEARRAGQGRAGPAPVSGESRERAAPGGQAGAGPAALWGRRRPSGTARVGRDGGRG